MKKILLRFSVILISIIILCIFNIPSEANACTDFCTYSTVSCSAGYMAAYVTQGAYWRCVADPAYSPDKCWNFSGTQSTVPDGYIQNISTGDCSFGGWSCPTVNMGNGHSVSVNISPNGSSVQSTIMNMTSLCSTYTAAAIGKYNQGITCGNTVFDGAVAWNPMFRLTPISGVCGSSNNTSFLTAPTSNLCSVGTASSVYTNSTEYYWGCFGLNGGSGVPCLSPRLFAVNGVCSQTTNNICTAGTYVDITDTLTQYKWNCNGLNGGTSASCSLNKPINALCGSINNSNQTWPSSGTWCSPGTQSGTIEGLWNQKGDQSNLNLWKWSCNGSNGGSSTSCSFTQQCGGGQVLSNGNCIAAPINGVCSQTTNNICTAGTSVDVADTSTQYKWNCNGLNGGTSVSCSLNNYCTQDGVTIQDGQTQMFYGSSGAVCGRGMNFTCNCGSFVGSSDISLYPSASCVSCSPNGINHCSGSDLINSCGTIINTANNDQICINGFIKDKKDLMSINSFLSNPGYIAKNSACTLKYDISNGSSTCSVTGLGLTLNPFIINLSQGSASGTIKTSSLASSTPYTLMCNYRDSSGSKTVTKNTMCRVVNFGEF